MAQPTPESITQSTPISEAHRLMARTDPVIVRATDSLHDLAELAVQNSQCRVLSVVDEKQRLIGLVPVRLLVNDIFLKIVPEEFLGVITDVDDVMEYARHVAARTAGEIMLDPVAVQATATVRDAFELMHKAHLNGLPVLDAEGRVTGYVDQLEMLLVWVRSSGRDGMLRPPPDPTG